MVNNPDSNPAALLRREGPIGIITLNRPSALNAVNAQMSTDVGRALEQLQSDDDLRVGVITGAGRAFCAGADLKALAARQSIYAAEHPEWGFAGLTQHFLDKPLIAAVNGFALGGGTEIVLACDIAVVSSEAHLGLPEVRRGIVAAAGGLLRLPEQIPGKIAAEMIYTGAPMTAAQALQWGLVNRVVPPEAVLDTALDLARAIALNAPLAVRASKRIVHKRSDFGSSWSPELWQMNAAEFEAVRTSSDAVEGARAFAEKRPPQWTGE